MEIVFLMRYRKRRQCYLLIAFFLMLMLYVGCYVFAPNSHVGAYYISQFLITTETSNLELIKKDISNKYSTSKHPLKVVNVQTTQSILSADISVKTISTGNENMFTVEHHEYVSKKLNRNVFVEMKDIKKSTANIFFIETRCVVETVAKHINPNLSFVLNARQCCAIESTALTNINREVYLFHSCPLSDGFINKSPKFVERLLSYPNIHVVRLNTTEVFFGSPLQQFQKENKLKTSSYPIEHSSDLLRLILLWKFGGTYSDLDVVTIRSFDGLETNWAGMQDVITIATGVINFEPAGIGHAMLQQALEHISKHYDGSNWSTNGPELITPIILYDCNVSTVAEAVKSCHVNFTVYDSSILYPLYYTQSDYFFNDDIGKKVVDDIKSKAYSVHLWNRMSREKKGRVGSTQAYALLADEFCPEVYQNCGTGF